MTRGIICSFDHDSSALIFINGPNARASQILRNDQAVVTSPATYPALLTPPTPSQRLSPSAAIDPNDANESGPSSSNLSPGVIEHLEISQTFNALELDNLRLMSHYFTHVWQSIVSDTDGEAKDNHHALWHDLIPGLAVTHPFLLHALLAVSAVHLALTTPASSAIPSELESLANIARHHHAQSLPLIRQTLRSPLDSTIIQPLFASSMFIAMYAFTHSLIQDARTDLDPLDEFSYGLTMLHGMEAVVQCDPMLLLGTPFNVMLIPNPRDPDAPLSPATEGYLAALRAAHARMTWPGGRDEADAYGYMIDILRYTFVLHRETSGRMMAFLPFAIKLPDLVLSGIREQQPLALCLVAGYATVLYSLKNNLWIHGWGEGVMEGVERKLAGTEWEEVIAWPSRVVSRDPS